MCVPAITFELNEPCPRYLARWITRPYLGHVRRSSPFHFLPSSRLRFLLTLPSLSMLPIPFPFFSFFDPSRFPSPVPLPLPSLEGPLRLLDRIQGHTRKQELINKYECWQHDDRIRFYNWCDAVLSLRHAWYCCFRAHCLTAISQLKRSLQHYCNLYKPFPTSWENCYVNQATAFNSVVAWCRARVLGYSPILAIAFSIACPFTSN